MPPVSNGRYETMIRFTRRDTSPSAPSLNTMVNQAFEELGYEQTYILGQDIEDFEKPFNHITQSP